VSRVRLRAVIVSIAVTACIAGCGADDGDSGRLSAREFRKQAQAICKKGNAAIDEVAADFGADGPTDQQLEEAAPKVPGLINDELDHLAALEPPEAIADEVDAMLDSFRTVVRSMEEQGVAFFARKDVPFAAAYGKAKDLGLDECAH
jgi:hypothetical protein